MKHVHHVASAPQQCSDVIVPERCASYNALITLVGVCRFLFDLLSGRAKCGNMRYCAFKSLTYTLSN